MENPDKTKILEVVKWLYHMNHRKPTTHDDVFSMVNFLRGMRGGLLHSDIEFGQSENDDIFKQVTLDFGFDWTSQAYWGLMLIDDIPYEEIYAKMIEFNIEVLKRRYQLTDAEIENVKSERAQYFEQRKQQAINRQKPKTTD